MSRRDRQAVGECNFQAPAITRPLHRFTKADQLNISNSGHINAADFKAPSSGASTIAAHNPASDAR